MFSLLAFKFTLSSKTFLIHIYQMHFKEFVETKEYLDADTDLVLMFGLLKCYKKEILFYLHILIV